MYKAKFIDWTHFQWYDYLPRISSYELHWSFLSLWNKSWTFLSKCPLPIHWSHRVCYGDFRAQQWHELQGCCQTPVKATNDLFTSNLSHLLLRRSTTYNLRGKDILAIPKVNSAKQGLRPWRHLAPKIWNALPEALKHETKLVSSFKRRLKEIDVT